MEMATFFKISSAVVSYMDKVYTIERDLRSTTYGRNGGPQRERGNLGNVNEYHSSSSSSSWSVNGTPTNTARTELDSMITFHHANTRGSRAGRLRIAHLCVPKTSVIHVSCLIPCRT